MQSNVWDGILSALETDFSSLSSGHNLSFQTELQFALKIISENPKLQKCSTESITKAFLNAARVSLTLEPSMKLAYLIERQGECFFYISYVGLLNVAQSSGSIMVGKAEVVYDKDTFTYNGSFEQPIHVFDPYAKQAQRGDFKGVYCLAKLSNGSYVVETLNEEEIEKIRQYSNDVGADSAWAVWFVDMAKKSAIRRAARTWPRTPRLAIAIAILNEQDTGPVDLSPDSPKPDIAVPGKVTPAFTPRVTGATVASAALAVPDSDERCALIATLEKAILEHGSAGLRNFYGQSTRDQRKLIGEAGLSQLLALGQKVDADRNRMSAANTEAQIETTTEGVHHV